MVAREFGHEQVYRLLLEHTPPDLDLALACSDGDEARVKALLTGHPDLPGALSAAEQRRLPDAARDGNAVGVRLMLEAGWPPDARGQHGATALHWAAWNGHPGMAQDLLAHRAAVEIADRDYGGTPLSWAVYGSVHGWRCRTGDYAGVVQLLLDAGARPPERTDIEASEAVRAVLRRWLSR